MSTITVVIANYRYEHLAAQAIESVLSQSRKPDRVLVVDDASHAPMLMNVRDTRIAFLCDAYPVDRLLRNTNLGVVSNFDDVLRNHVTTDKVMFLGADNWLRPDALELMDAAGGDIVSSDIYLVGNQADQFSKTLTRGYTERKDGYLVWRFNGGDMSTDNHIHGSSLYNVKLAQKFGYKRSPKSYRTAEDWELWKAMLADGAQHVHVQEPLLYYRRHDKNANTTR